jgi:hypothetical protein
MHWCALAANSLWWAGCMPAWRSFRRALAEPEAAQATVLKGLLKRNRGCAFGVQHKLGSVTGYRAFARQVPLCSYEDIAPWVERIRHGEQRLLTSDEVSHLIPTSGSSGGRKLIPFTARLQREFDRAIGPWVCDLFKRCPALFGGPAYWSISPATRSAEQEASAVPIGFQDDASYLGGAKRLLVRRAMAVPAAVGEIDQPDEFRFRTLSALLRQSDLRLVSVWHPSFLTLLLDALPPMWDRLLEDLSEGCPRRARELAGADPRVPGTLWPRLRVISCWGDAHAALELPALQRRFPGTIIQRKGLLATEAFVTVPCAGSHPLALRSHFFEFADDAGDVRLAHQLAEGETYEVIVTTGGGLWRYRLGDLVRVSGFLHATPTLEFVGRKGQVSDLRGEKLSETFVAAVVQRVAGALRTEVRFAMLAPEATAGGSWRYTLFLEAEADPSAWSRELETQLRSNPQYDHCRRLGQLEEARVRQVPCGAGARYLRCEAAAGRRLGEIKSTYLSGRTDWAERLSSART